MEIRKLVLYFAIAVVGVMLWNAWLHDYPPQVKTSKSSAAMTAQSPTSPAITPYVPSFSPQKNAGRQIKQPTVVTPATISSGKTITVKTDVLNVKIDTKGGNIITADLPKYPVSLKKPEDPIKILNDNPAQIYIAQSGVTNTTMAGKTAPIQYTAQKSNYVLAPDQKQMVVTLRGKTANGLEVKKNFIFERNNYAVKIEYLLQNPTNKTWEGSVFNQITRRNVPLETRAHTRSYDGAAISSPEKPYEKLTYKKLNEGNIDRNIEDGWIAMQQQYFLSAWVPEKNQTNHYYSHVTPTSNSKENIYTIGYIGPNMVLAPNANVRTESTFYVGPEVGKRLKEVAKGLELTIDYGWLWPISKIIFWVMAKIHSIVGNWGWSIVLVTLLIKLLFYTLSDKSYKSMVKMRELQPRLQMIKERYADDKAAMSKATMELYKKEKVNPMGSCLPMIIQIPVFIALYYVLIESVQLRQAPWIFWIHDLSVKDPYYVLPILMGLSMLLQQKISPPPPDPTQAKVMMLMPVVFTVFFLNFPSGLVLYWLTNNVLSILQQWYTMRTYKPKESKKKKKKKKS